MSSPRLYPYLSSNAVNTAHSPRVPILTSDGEAWCPGLSDFWCAIIEFGPPGLGYAAGHGLTQAYNSLCKPRLLPLRPAREKCDVLIACVCLPEDILRQCGGTKAYMGRKKTIMVHIDELWNVLMTKSLAAFDFRQCPPFVDVVGFESILPFLEVCIREFMRVHIHVYK